MSIFINEEDLKRYNLTESEFRIEMSTHLYQIGKMSIGQASKFAELDRISFQRELGKRNIDLNISIDDLHHDLETLKSLNL